MGGAGWGKKGGKSEMDIVQKWGNTVNENEHGEEDVREEKEKKQRRASGMKPTRIRR